MLRSAILGGGIAGLGAAIALAGRGFEVEVFERHAAPTDIGAGIVCWPNASFVLQELGLLDSVAGLAGRPTRMRRVSWTGEELGALDIRKLDQLMGSPSLSVLRRELQAALLSRVDGLGIRVRNGHAADRIEPSPAGPASVHFANGATVAADVILGADGRMRSVARAFVHGDNRPRYQGFVNWLGTFESDRAVFSESQIEVMDCWGVGVRFGVVPVSRSKAYWAGAAPALKLGAKSQPDHRAELRALFRGWPSPIPELIEETPPERIEQDLRPRSRSHRHVASRQRLADRRRRARSAATSGQGASQALEDAWHLAECLSSAASLEEAFTAFTKRRHAKNAAINAGARDLARSLFATDPALCERGSRGQGDRLRGHGRGMARGWSSGLPMSASRTPLGSASRPDASPGGAPSGAPARPRPARRDAALLLVWIVAEGAPTDHVIASNGSALTRSPRSAVSTFRYPSSIQRCTVSTSFIGIHDPVVRATWHPVVRAPSSSLRSLPRSPRAQHPRRAQSGRTRDRRLLGQLGEALTPPAGHVGTVDLVLLEGCTSTSVANHHPPGQRPPGRRL